MSHLRCSGKFTGMPIDDAHKTVVCNASLTDPWPSGYAKIQGTSVPPDALFRLRFSVDDASASDTRVYLAKRRESEQPRRLLSSRKSLFYQIAGAQSSYLKRFWWLRGLSNQCR